MSEEVAALHRALFEVQDDKTLGDPALWRELAVRYLDGRGVEQDVIQGCARLSRADSVNCTASSVSKRRRVAECGEQDRSASYRFS